MRELIERVVARDFRWLQESTRRQMVEVLLRVLERDERFQTLASSASLAEPLLVGQVFLRRETYDRKTWSRR